MKSPLEFLQKLGRALMLPIAVLPVAGLLLRLGQPDLLAFAPMAAAGDAIFSNLGLLFAIGVAVGLARENNGAAVPAAVLAAVTGDAAQAAANWKARELAKLSVPLGIISGVLGGVLYNRYSDI